MGVQKSEVSRNLVRNPLPVNQPSAACSSRNHSQCASSPRNNCGKPCYGGEPEAVGGRIADDLVYDCRSGLMRPELIELVVIEQTPEED